MHQPDQTMSNSQALLVNEQVLLNFILYLAVLTASISRDFLGGRCAWLKEQPGMLSL